MIKLQIAVHSLLQPFWNTHTPSNKYTNLHSTALATSTKIHTSLPQQTVWQFTLHCPSNHGVRQSINQHLTIPELYASRWLDLGFPTKPDRTRRKTSGREDVSFRGIQWETSDTSQAVPVNEVEVVTVYHRQYNTGRRWVSRERAALSSAMTCQCSWTALPPAIKRATKMSVNNLKYFM